MHSLIIKPKEVISFKGSEYLITKIVDLKSVIAVGPEGVPVILPIKDLEPSTKTQKDLIVNFETLTDKDWKIAQDRFSIIRPILENRGDGELIDAISIKTKIHRSTLYRWIHSFERTGLVSSLAPIEKDGGRGKSRLSKELDLIINASISDVYLTSDRKPIHKTILEVQTRCRNAGLDAPHENTIRQRIAQITEYDRLKFRYGERAAKEAFGAFPGKFPGADYPLAYVQIDHTKVDVIIVDEVNRKPIGRPWLTVAIDVFSRMVLGFYISLDPPGAMGTGLCIAMAIAPKEDILIANEIDAEWPCWGVMRCIHMDNAKEFRGLMIRNSCQQYGIETNFRKVKTPNWGGHIESLMGTFAEEIHTLPGTTFSNPQERQNYKSEKKAALSLNELEVWLLTYITKVYHQKIHSSLLTSPLAKFKEGILPNKDGLGIGLPPRITDKEKLTLDFTPFVLRSIQSYGVKLNNIKYYHESLQKWINSSEKKRGQPKAKKKFMFKVDPRNIKYIYFFEPDLKQYFQVPYSDTSKPNMSIWEYREVVKGLRDAGKKHIDESSIFEGYRVMNEIVDNAKLKTKKTNKKHLRSKERKSNPIIREQPSFSFKENQQQTNNTKVTPFDEIDYGTPE